MLKSSSGVFVYQEGKFMPSIDMTATGANIKQTMKSKRISISQMQKVFGFNTPQAIYKWFRGDAMPTIDNMVILAEIFDTTIDQLIIVNK